MLLHASIIKNLQTLPLSLAELQILTQVSLPTLRKAVQELADSRWIRVVGQSGANGGRPPMLFGLDEAFYMLIGVHVQLPGLRLIVTDLMGNILDEQATFQQKQPTPDEVVSAIADYAHHVQSRLSDRKLLGVGIAAPGFTEPETGNIITIERVSGWHDFPICQRLESMLVVPVQIANDVDCMAFAEFQTMRKSFSGNLTYVGFDEGVKVSMFLNGELYKGSFGNAGLIVNRFLRVPDESLTVDDQRQMLCISGINVHFEARVAALPADEQSAYQRLLTLDNRERLEAIFREAQNGLSVCGEVSARLNAVLSTAIANIIYVIQPDVVVVGGILSAMPPALFNSLSAAIRAHLPPLFANRVQIEQAQVRASSIAALGATYHFIDNHLLRESFALSGML